MADIFREVEEDLRRDNLARIWQRYGAYLIGLAVAIALGTAAWVAWDRYAERQAAERARAYAAATALVERGDRPAALEALGGIAESSGGYAILARLRQAALLAEAGDAAGAVALYEALAADSAAAEPYRQLALLLIGLHTLDTADPAALRERLAPLTAAGNPWRYSALEITALLALRAGETERARELLAELAEDAAAPLGVRERSAELLASLQG